jgi:hypothetical protein
MQLHDHTERRKMFMDFGSTKFDEIKVEAVAADLPAKLTTNPFFANLENAVRKDLLKGGRASILTNKEIALRMGNNEQRI